MKPLYELLFRFLAWHHDQVDRALFWLWLRLTNEPDECEAWQAPPRENVVHLPRRGLH